MLGPGKVFIGDCLYKLNHILTAKDNLLEIDFIKRSNF